MGGGGWRWVGVRGRRGKGGGGIGEGGEGEERGGERRGWGKVEKMRGKSRGDKGARKGREEAMT